MSVNLKCNETARHLSTTLQKLEPKNWYLLTPMDHYRHHHPQNQHYHLAHMQQLGHLLTRSGLRRLDISSVVSPGSFFQMVCRFF
jgi:hypothetical protein